MPISDEITQSDVDHYIAQVEASGELGRSKRRIRLLAHLIQSELLEQGDRLKAYSIGLDIFNKPSEFDPASDSVVRVEMGRLRSALALFEASAFADTRIVVDIPVGTYRPSVTLRSDHSPVAVAPKVSLDNPAVPSSRHLRPIYALGAAVLLIAVAVAVWMSAGPLGQHRTIDLAITLQTPDDPLAIAARSTLSQALARSKTITLHESDGDAGGGSDTSFIVRLSVLENPTSKTAFVELFDAVDMRLLWGKTIEEAENSALLERMEGTVARELRVRVYGASKELLSRLDPEKLSPEALFVLATWVPGVAHSAIAWEQERVGFAKAALIKAPEFGAAHSVLADKLAYLANVYAPMDTSENRVAAIDHAKRAVALSPLDPDVMFNVAQAYWHSGHISDSQAMMARVAELDPNHDLATFLGLVIKYSCSAAPDEIVNQAIAFDTDLSTDNPIRWLTLTWIGWLHAYRGEWDEALEAEEAAARIFEIPYTFMRRAMVLHQLGRSAEAFEVINGQLERWKGFEAAHFVRATIPRLCTENPDSDQFIQYYADLVQSLEDSATD